MKALSPESEKLAGKNIMDPISDMLIRIKNASAVKKETALVPHSKIKHELARILKESGYISKFERRGKKNRKMIEIELSYDSSGRPSLSGTKRISKPSRRVYMPAREIRKVKQGSGIAVISTSRGLKTDKEARAEHLGGEVICEIW